MENRQGRIGYEGGSEVCMPVGGGFVKGGRELSLYEGLSLGFWEVGAEFVGGPEPGLLGRRRQFC